MSRIQILGFYFLNTKNVYRRHCKSVGRNDRKRFGVDAKPHGDEIIDGKEGGEHALLGEIYQILRILGRDLSHLNTFGFGLKPEKGGQPNKVKNFLGEV